MAYEAKEVKDFTTPSAPKMEYPHGLKLRLDKQTLEKLGFMKLPGVEEKFMIMAVAEVVEVSKEGDEEYVCLQIKDMDLKKKESAKGPESVLYGDA